MITKQQIEGIVLPLLEGPEEFLVAIKVSADNNIVVEIDHMKGVTIDRCVCLSKAIEAQLDREVEDFSIEVASAGLTAPYTVPLQYKKHLTQPVTAVLKDGMRYDGVLSEVRLNETEDELLSISVEIEEKVPASPNSKKKVLQVRGVEIAASEIKKVMYRF